MTAIALPAAGRPIPVGLIGDAVFWFAVASGAVVMFEPAPYDALLSLCGLIAFFLGLRIVRAQAPLVTLLLLFQAGGLLPLILPLTFEERTRWFVVTSLLLAFVCVYIASSIAARPDRLRLAIQAYVVAGVIASILGIVGYLGHVEMLTLYGRAKGAFKDPNVFGPFLIMPFLVVVRALIIDGMRRIWLNGPLFALFAIAILFSFSRAAWFLAGFGAVLIWMLAFIETRNPHRRIHYLVLAAVGVTLAALALGALMSVPEINEMLANRAKLVQDYDGGRLGRLARHAIGFGWVMEQPLGIGPFEFAGVFREDPHNVYLKAFLGYGWLGGLAYVALLLVTLKRLGSLLFLDRPWRGVAQITFVTLLGHIVIGWIIDSDHWRHFFFIIAVAWGMVALEKHPKSDTGF